MIRRIAAALVLALALCSCAKSPAARVQTGDIVFQELETRQSEAIRIASDSKFSHVGIVFIRSGVPYVYEAVGPVRLVRLKKWGRDGKNGEYEVRRLKRAAEILTDEAKAKLFDEAEKYKGLPYDWHFGWSDEKMYCSEFVWKVYQRGLGIRVGETRQLKDYDLSSPVVKAILEERYGDNIPLDEQVVAPEDLFRANILEPVEALP